MAANQSRRFQLVRMASELASISGFSAPSVAENASVQTYKILLYCCVQLGRCCLTTRHCLLKPRLRQALMLRAGPACRRTFVAAFNSQPTNRRKWGVIRPPWVETPPFCNRLKFASRCGRGSSVNRAPKKNSEFFPAKKIKINSGAGTGARCWSDVYDFINFRNTVCKIPPLR